MHFVPRCLVNIFSNEIMFAVSTGPKFINTFYHDTTYVYIHVHVNPLYWGDHCSDYFR